MIKTNRSFAWWLIPISSLIILAIVQIASSFLKIDWALWQHLLKYILPEVVWNTLGILFFVSSAVLFIGISLAWLIANYHFPGRSFFSGALILPLAIPPYIMSIVYIGVLDYSGPVQRFFRQIFNVDDSLWDIRSWWGIILVLSLSLYPYVYLIARNAFLSQGKSLVDTANVLGLNKRQFFWRVALPMSRPWWMAGLYLVMMETISDFGSFSAFGINNMTTTIYKAWFGLQDYQLALQLSALLLVGALIFLSWPKLGGARQQFVSKEGRQSLNKLSGKAAGLAFCWTGLIFVGGVVFPIITLVWWAWQTALVDLDYRYFEFVRNTLLLGTTTAAVTVVLGLIISLSGRYCRNIFTRLFIKLAIIGYAVPGMVLAVSIFIPFILFDFWLAEVFGKTSFLSGTFLALVLILSQRFLSLSYQSTAAALKRITTNHDLAAASCGAGKIRIFFSIYLPLLKKSLLGGFLLVLVDSMKELPITLIARPFGWDTLAVRVFEMTSAGFLQKAALPSLFIILVGILAIITFNRQIESNYYGRN